MTEADRPAVVRRKGPLRREVEYLRRINEDYRIMAQVLSALVERYLLAIGEDVVVITDQQVREAPDLISQRDATRGRISMRVSR